MNKKIIGFFFVTMLIVTFEPISGDTNFYSLNSDKVIFLEIEETRDKSLIFDDIIGDLHVKYWEHIINGVYVKNDSILLHMDKESNEIINYKRSWIDFDIDLDDYLDEDFKPMNFFWKKLVVFPDPEDCTYFYSFYQPVNYPIVCWEVRYINGSTILYNINKECIGEGISAPFEQGFSISNDCENGAGDCWRSYRENANEWFKRWCDSTISIGLPTLEEISSNIKNRNTTFFFELGHSHYLPTRFLIGDGIYYNASQLKNDIVNRQPMKFAFIGSCEGLRKIGPGNLSYEFRKGEMNGTVTIGYVGMAECPGWSVSLFWQNYMFMEMDSGLTIKKSFDLASAEYPTIASCVRFVGDENLIVGNNPPSIPKKPISNLVNAPNEITYFNTTTFDPEGDSLFYLFDWGDGTNSGWLGPYKYGKFVLASHFWNNKGIYNIKVKAKDEKDAESQYSSSFKISITNPPNRPETPTGPLFGKTGIEYTFTTSASDPDGDALYYMWNWGDGNVSEWLSNNVASYSWEQQANFNISVKAKDIFGAESNWSEPLVFRMAKIFLYTPIVQLLMKILERFSKD